MGNSSSSKTNLDNYFSDTTDILNFINRSDLLGQRNIIYTSKYNIILYLLVYTSKGLSPHDDVEAIKLNFKNRLTNILSNYIDINNAHIRPLSYDIPNIRISIKPKIAKKTIEYFIKNIWDNRVENYEVKADWYTLEEENAMTEAKDYISKFYTIKEFSFKTTMERELTRMFHMKLERNSNII
jgi:hypothetical protein